MVFTDDDVDYAALIISPLDTGRALARTAEAEPFFRGAALSRYLDERSIDHDTLFRERD